MLNGGSFESCADIANKSQKDWAEKEILPQSLTELRTCLFFEQRHWRHFGAEPDNKEKEYLHAFIESIRSKLRDRENQSNRIIDSKED